MHINSNHAVHCSICGQRIARSMALPGEMIRTPIADLIRVDHPQWNDSGVVCFKDLNHYRSQYVQHMLETERGELTRLEEEVLRSLREHEILTANLNEDFASRASFGERVSDGLARFGGSWSFLLVFAALLALWIAWNASSGPAGFDPFPFILLNLILSCLAAVQAPVIMMSQNRQEAKDRLRAEHDYRVNLKAELEIRHLHAKMDLLLTHQWQRLLEIQQVQTDLLEELSRRHR